MEGRICILFSVGGGVKSSILKFELEEGWREESVYCSQLEGAYCSLVFQSLSWTRDGWMNLYTVQLEGECSLVFQSLSCRRDGWMHLYTVQLEGEYCSLVFQSLS